MSNRRKLVWAVLALIGASLACSAPNVSNPASTPPSPEAVPAEATAVSPTQNVIYLPSISTDGTPGAEQAQPSGADPHVEIQASQTELKVGETVTVLGSPVDIGLPNYYLIVRDEGNQDSLPMVLVTYDNTVTPQAGTSRILDFVSAQGQLNQVSFVLKAKAPGVTAITITATGEVQSSGGVTWSGGGSGTVMITVSP